MQIDLSGKIALVTGASQGIGAAIAQVLGSCGAKVALHYNSSEKQAKAIQEALGSSCACFQADLSDMHQVAGLVKRVIRHYNGLDIVVNNAAIALRSPIDHHTPSWMEDWRKTLDVNLLAPAVICKEAVGYYIDQKGGIMINISSRAAFRGDTPDYMAYAASKGGLVALTRSIARAYGKDNILAYNLAPGFTKTSMAQDFIDRYGESFVTNDLALNELTTPADIAPMAAFLASGMAKHATGATIDINAASYVH